MARKRKKKLKTLVDIVIPVYGRFDLLEKCLNSIPAAMGEISHTVTIVDNGSPDREDFYLTPGYGWKWDFVKVITNNQNKGFIGASNQGAYAGRSPLIFFLNSDIILEPNSVAELVKSLDEPKIGIAGMKLLFPDAVQIQESGLDTRIRPPQKVQHVGLNTNVRGEVTHTFIGWSAEAEKVNLVDMEKDEEGNDVECPYHARTVMSVTGAALLVRRELFRRVGGFDKDFGMGTYEDVSLCLAVRELGYNVVVNPQAVATHFVGATAEKYQQNFPLNENYQIFINKWRDKLKQWDYNVL